MSDRTKGKPETGAVFSSSQNSDHPDKCDHSTTEAYIVAINHILALVMSGVMFMSASLVWSERRGQVPKCDEDAEARVVAWLQL